MTELKDLLSELNSAEGRDYEGDKNCRVHITTARELIERAFKAGKESVSKPDEKG